MARYRKTLVRKWNEPWFQNLGPLAPCPQSLYLWLHQGPNSTPIPGVTDGKPRVLAAEIGWPDSVFNGLAKELVQSGALQFDPATGLWWMPNELFPGNLPGSLNVVRGWGKVWAEIVDSDLKLVVWQQLKAFVYGMADGKKDGKGVAFREAYDMAFSMPCVIQQSAVQQSASSSVCGPDKPSPMPSAKTSGKASDNGSVDTHTGKEDAVNADLVEQLFKERIFQPYHPQRKSERLMPRYIGIFAKMCIRAGDATEETARVGAWIDDLKKSKDWKDGVLKKLDNFLLDLPAGYPTAGKIRAALRRTTELPPPDDRCPTCNGWGFDGETDDQKRCSTCNGSGRKSAPAMTDEAWREGIGKIARGEKP